MATTLSYFVPGVPAPKGSMKAFVPKGWKRAVITHDNASSKPWASVVTLATAAAVTKAGWLLTDEPVQIKLAFWLPRPKSHFRADGSTKHLAPNFHTSKPDLDKLTRLVGDALTGLVYRDDAQVWRWIIGKHYAEKHDTCGVQIIVWSREVLL